MQYNTANNNLRCAAYKEQTKAPTTAFRF